MPPTCVDPPSIHCTGILDMSNLGGLSPLGTVTVGVIVGLISTSLQAIGLTLQRKSHILEDEKNPFDLRRPPYRRRRWQLGMFMFVFANIIGSSIQITTLPLPVLSTLQASGLVFNTIFATLILGEPFTRYSLIGTVLVCMGAILIAIFGAIEEPAHSLRQLLDLLQRRAFVLWMIGTAALVLVILLGSRLLKLLSSRSNSSTHPQVSHSHLLPILQSRLKLICGMSYGFVSGVLSAHSLLLAKSAVELLVRTVVDRTNQFNRWQSWAILISMILLALIQLFYLHRGLKLCSTSILYPFVFCIYNIIAILDGLIYFRQVSQLSSSRAVLIALGTVVLLSGVLCLSWRLEDIESHAVAGSGQAVLGPNMGFIDGQSQSAGNGDEESPAGEREPLLSTIGARPEKRAPNLPSIDSPFPFHHRRTSASDVDPAYIWAELDDSDYEFDSLHHTGRPRSKSGSFTPAAAGRNGGDYMNFLVPSSGRSPLNSQRRARATSQTWNPSDWRRSTTRRSRTALFDRTDSERERPTMVGYGTVGSYLRNGSKRDPSGHALYRQEPSSSSGSGLASGSISSPLLAGSRTGRRTTITAVWQTGVMYLQRWTGQG